MWIEKCGFPAFIVRLNGQTCVSVFRQNQHFNWFGSKKMKIKKNSKHFWLFCCIVTEDEIITCKSDFVSSLCVYYLRAALEVLLIISVQLDRGKECSL